MNAPVMEVEKSETIDERIRSMCVNYMKLMVECMEDDTVREDFLSNPHPYLNDKVGMKIPNNVGVMFDENLARWPSIYINTPDGDKVAIKESSLGLEVVSDLISGTKIDESWKLAERAKIDVKLHTSLEKSDAVVVLPFIDPRVDILGEYKFNDGSEIILSSA